MDRLDRQRIALVGPTVPFRGGISHHTTLLFRALRSRHEVRLYSFRQQYPAWLYPGASDREPSGAFSSDPSVHYCLDPLRPTTWVKTARAIAAWRADVVIVPWWVVVWAPQTFVLTRALRRRTSAAIVFLCHNVIGHDAFPFEANVAASVLGAGDVHLCHTDEEADQLRAWFPRGVVRKVAHPSYAALAGPKGGHRARRLVSQPPKLLFFGFIRPYKGLDVLLRAMPRVHERTGARLQVVGEAWKLDDDTRARLERCERSGFVFSDLRYVGSDELPAIFSSVDLVVLPYRTSTGCGVAQLAVGAGVPVVASRVGSLQDVVEDGFNGVLTRPGDPAALAGAIERALSPQEYSTLSEGAASARFEVGWDSLVEEIEASIAEISRPRAGGAG